MHPGDDPATYRVSIWDHELDDWVAEASGLGRWVLRGVLRDLEGRGYDRDCSILVERE